MSEKHRTRFKVRKNDLVKVTAGKDRGRTGKVLSVLPAASRVVVEGVNMIRRHTKGNQEQPGRIIEREAPLHISNVALWHADESRRIKVGWTVLEDGRKVRVDKKTGQPIDNQ